MVVRLRKLHFDVKRNGNFMVCTIRAPIYGCLGPRDTGNMYTTYMDMLVQEHKKGLSATAC